MTKVGNWFLASELAKQVGERGILNVSQNPGNLKTNLLRSAPMLMRWASAPLLYEAKMGAYTELWAVYCSGKAISTLTTHLFSIPLAGHFISRYRFSNQSTELQWTY